MPSDECFYFDPESADKYFYSFLFMVTWFAMFMILFKLTNLYKEGSSQALLMLCNRTVGVRLQMETCLCSTVQCSSAR